MANEDLNHLRETKEYTEEEAQEAAKEIFAPLQQAGGNKEAAYAALDRLLESDFEFKAKYDEVLNKILAEALYKALSNMELEENIDEGEVNLSKAAAKRY